MEQETRQSIDFNTIVREIPATAVKVITNATTFFREMPKVGGFVEPLIFMVGIGIVTGVINFILSLFGVGYAQSFGMALTSIVLTPILVAIFGFVGALILFLIWKILGSQESYETAYRCGAYVTAISPITTILHIIPYLGSILSLLWMTYLIVIASSEVHNIQRKKAWIVFGIIFVIFAIMSLTSQFAARRMASRMERFQQEMGKQMKDLSPEEARKAAQDLLKQMQQRQQK
ncbi:MAG: YIP1 family protein [Deltaproteobacteria bacterium]|nr:YIP1 family protein [Deltaproteobacteria bacterium]MBW1928427.1 YIP1 family protein [Deltaproteobacteria bacterium]MBW2024239.1 YIP1 family protein [Deltaproteobacteria bacterium]MBW2127292.1 YIP1 family protein [Deltaproteobacteria bacterium]RLB20559.1 MAG: hypothetical protein DRG76_10770 [Deltaproteobacteria bacterium]